MKLTHAFALVFAGAAVFATGLVTAGPLSPPAGPVASTYKTLAEVEPRTAVGAATTPGDAAAAYIITQPGSYYLTGDIAIPSGKYGVRIEASDVTLDLNGFGIAGAAPGGGGSLGGIVGPTSPGYAGITVRNGSIRQTGGPGIRLNTVTHCTVEDVTVRGNAGIGVWMGDFAVLQRVAIDANAVGAAPVTALSGGFGSRLIACTVTNSNGGGIYANQGVISDCHASFNTGSGISGENNSVISNCTVYNNTLDGINCRANTLVIACTAEFNGGRGIDATFGANIRDCTAAYNQGGGIACTNGGTISGCVASSNYNFGGTATSNGFLVGAGTVVTGCSASFSSASGFAATAEAGEGVTIAGCTARGNNIHGIAVSSDSLVQNNACSGNGANGFTGAGIYASGSDNRVEHNNCTDSTWGINIDGPGNVILSNSCSGNASNWRFVSNNIFGPVLDRTAPAVSGMLGNGPVPSTVGSADPHANISY